MQGANVMHMIQNRTSERTGMNARRGTTNEMKQKDGEMKLQDEINVKQEQEEKAEYADHDHASEGGKHEMGSRRDERGNATSSGTKKQRTIQDNFHSRSPLPAHTMIGTCIHRPATTNTSTMVPAKGRNKKKKASISSNTSPISSVCQQEQQKEEDLDEDSSKTSSEHEASVTKSGSAFESTSERSDSERSLGVVGDRGKDERRERNRFLARKRRERKTKWNDSMRAQIDHVAADNQELRNKNKALVQELISLGVDARTVMSKIAPLQTPSSSSIIGATDPGTSIKFPNQIINASRMSSNSAPLNSHQSRQLLSLLGTADVHTDGPLPQLPSPFFPSPALPLQTHQMMRSLIHLPSSQQNPWQQQSIPVANSDHNNGQAAPTAAESNITIASDAGAHRHHAPSSI
eukprot:scaffold6761_cov256-Chaetoceros_neogracile.AAC.1